MIEPEYVVFGLPELDRRADPRGGAVAWALLTVFVTLVAGIALSITFL